MIKSAFAQSTFISGRPIQTIDDQSHEVTGSVDYEYFFTSVTYSSDAKVLVGQTFTDLKLINPLDHRIYDSIDVKLAEIVCTDHPDIMIGRYEDDILRIDLRSKSVTSIPIPGNKAISFRFSSKDCWVLGQHSIYVLDYLGKLEVQAQYNFTGANSYESMLFTPDGRSFVLLSTNEQELELWDADAFEIVRSKNFDAKLISMALDPSGKLVYVYNQKGAELLQIDLETLTIRDRLPIAKPIHALFHHPEKLELWALANVDHRVFTIDADKFELIEEFAVGERPWTVAFRSGSKEEKQINPASNQFAYPNPSNGVISLQGHDNGKSWELRTFHGQFVASGTLDQDNGLVDITSLKSGLYLLYIDSVTHRIFKY